MRFSFILIVLLLNGCASLELKNSENITYKQYQNTKKNLEISEFQLTGKISFFVEQKGFSGFINWKFSNNRSSISIYNPFNTLVSKITLNSITKTIDFKPNSKTKNEIESLIYKIFGNKEEIFGLNELLINYPVQLSETNNVSVSLNNWAIKFKGLMKVNNINMPHIIEIEKKPLALKLFITEWVI
tara:strand:+ start:832 stop:1389 length:558 start_codon:yes stop_codon:yes gene_type:complete